MWATKVERDEIRELWTTGSKENNSWNSGHVTILNGNFLRQTRSTKDFKNLARSKAGEVREDEDTDGRLCATI
jgi:hypothetical protein